MNLALFCHTLLSDWNHGNAHFLRGVVTDLVQRGHTVRVYEPRDAWSVENLIRDTSPDVLDLACEAYPHVRPIRYDPHSFDVEAALAGVDLAIVHEWSPPSLVRAVGEMRARRPDLRALFCDTHNRAVTSPEAMSDLDLSGYDGVLAFGEVLRRIYVARGWARRAWTWHEAADARLFRPLAPRDEACVLDARAALVADLVWVGNWGDDERTCELEEFLIGPVKELGLSARVFGVRYPAEAIQRLSDAGIAYEGWLPNFRVPEVFARHRVTVHVPRRPYARALPGIPTIRPFEALASGIPLVSAPWDDVEHLFTAGKDYLVARDGDEMRAQLSYLLARSDRAAEMARHGRATILTRHTCMHRVDELLGIARALGVGSAGRIQAARAS